LNYKDASTTTYDAVPHQARPWDATWTLGTPLGKAYALPEIL